MILNLKLAKKCNIFKKGQQQMHFLRELMLKNNNILTLFYRAFRAFSPFNHILVGNLSVSDKSKLKKKKSYHLQQDHRPASTFFTKCL